MCGRRCICALRRQHWEVTGANEALDTVVEVEAGVVKEDVVCGVGEREDMH